MNSAFLEQYTGCRYNILTSFGRNALYLLLKTLRVEGKEVLVPAFICTSVTNAIFKAGGKPIFVDINIHNLSINLDEAETKITPSTIAIIFVHYFGFIYPEIENLKTFSSKHHLFLIEDCAQSLGGLYDNQRVGSIGDAAIFSFTKNTLAFGGGCVGTNNKELYAQLEQEVKKQFENENSFVQTCRKFIITSIYFYRLCVDKGIYDKPERNIFKWWLINLPDYILNPITIFKKTTPHRNNLFNNTQLLPIKDNFLNIAILPLSLTYYSVRIQLKKLDRFNKQRMEIVDKIRRKVPNLYYNINSKTNCVHVGTYFPLQIRDTDIDELLSKFKNQGILLRKTWPAFQNYTTDQRTKNISVISSTLLLLEINPYLKIGGINKITNLLAQYKYHVAD